MISILCKLTVSGSVESMNEFYSVLNSGSTKVEKNRFRMDKFIPIPSLLLNEDFEFKPISTIVNTSDTGNLFEDVDSEGRTEDEFKKYVSLVEETFGTSVKEEWCEFNWGCEEDVEVIEEILCSDEEYCVKYWTNELPNCIFVNSLHDEYFGNLDLKLEYLSCEFDYSGTDEYLPKKTIYTIHKCECINFQEIPGTEKFRFISSVDEDDLPDHYIDILGGDWVKSLKDDGFTKTNVVNWDELVDSMKDYE